MKPLRAFLFSRTPSGEWTSVAFRELEPLLEAIEGTLAVEAASAAVHIGFWRPETAKVAELAEKWGGRLLFSNAAICALPPPVSVSVDRVGEVEGLPFHIVLNGFGYQIEDPTICKNQKNINTNSGHEAESLAPRGWVEQLILQKPESKEILFDSGIWDDESYHENEPHLDIGVRLNLALDRYRIAVGSSVNQTNILNNLHACPNWFLNDELRFLDLSVRTRNVCAAFDMKTIGDFASKGYGGLLKLPNMGQGSVHALGVVLWQALLSGEGLRRKKLLSTVETTNGPYNVRIAENEQLELPEVPPAPSIANIWEGFIEAAQALTEEERGIWAARLGFRSKPQTLQNIAEQVGLTRERVRQIEVKIYKKIGRHPFWTQLLEVVRQI